MTDDVDLEAIRAAAPAVAGVAKRTPVVSSTTLSNTVGGEVALKAENLQRTGSFKLRGAMNKVASVVAGSTDVAGVVTGSAGNHGQALAYAAQHVGIPCEIVVPVGSPVTKIEACRAFGANVVEHGADLRAAVAYARERAETTGMTFCAPFDDPVVVSGQGTLGLELVDDIDRLAAVVVPLGGGGLAGGIAVAVKTLRPEARVIGVQAAVCAPYCGRPVAEGPVLTLADGIAVKYPGEVTGPIVERYLDEVVCVDEDAIGDAMVMLLDRAKLSTEGAGAVGVAALLAGAIIPATTGVTCVVLSGGNVDLGVVPGLIRRSEHRAGRRLSIRVTIDDRPGGLARLLTVFAEGGADLIDVEHLREGVDLHVRETGIHATFQVRSADQAVELVARARAAGYDVRVENTV